MLDVGIKGTLQEIALKVAEQQMKEQETENTSKERTIFVLGSKEVGKSSIINNFLDRDETSRPTLALEYSYGRRSATGQGIRKQVCNVWELGSLSNSHHLIDIPIKSHGLASLHVVIVLDLSVPERLWADLEGSLNGLQQSVAGHATVDAIEHLKKNIRQLIGDDHPDQGTLNVLPFPVLIVGGKYDKFQSFDPEIKKHVCRCLRSISHTVGAALLFFSTRNAGLSKTVRDACNHFGFGSPAQPIRQTLTDYNGPISIWFGKDSWEQIGVTPTNSERIGIALGAHIPQLDNGGGSDDFLSLSDPAQDAGFREPVIDELRFQKYEELLRFIKDSEIRAKFQTVSIS